MTVERRDGTGKAVLVLPLCEVVPAWLGESCADATFLPLGPRRWLVVSDERSGVEIVADWKPRFTGVTHLFEDASDRFVVLRVTGSTALRWVSEQLVQPIDVSSNDSVTRTLLGEAPVICRCIGDSVDVLVDCSYAHYAQAWLRQMDAP
jgi:sarcosine oxidase gamma subunit